MNHAKHSIGEVEVELEYLDEALRCLIHTIVFHRALNNTTPRDIDSDLLDLTYPSVQSDEICKTIDSNIEKFTTAVKQKHKDTKNVKLGSFQVLVSFVTIQITKGLFGSSNKQTIPWEVWVLNMKVTKGGKRTLRDLAEDVTNRMRYIGKTASDKTDHLPPLTKEKTSMSGCYPFQITFPLIESEKGFFNFIKNLV